MRASGNRIVRGAVRALESQVVNTARYMGRPERAMCVASNRGHRRVYEYIAAHDPSGVAEAMHPHHRSPGSSAAVPPGGPVPMDRQQASPAAAPRCVVALGLVSVARHRGPLPYGPLPYES
ncbi:FCD domain-containing protein [Streptomyces umbrinus]|uniref:FCD domain-containing protein n=1 Tax=Streptomyces umbrinus TaxID=67370 RepID=UPI003F4D5E59